MAREIHLTNGMASLVDDEDFAELCRFRWYAFTSHTGLLYAVRSGQSGETSMVRLHRQLLGARPGQIVDHINRNTLDNRRVNLRIATLSENGQNRKANGACPYLGVNFHKRGGPHPWYFRLRAHGKRYTRGCFTSAEAAARAYDDLAIELHGPLAATNFPHPKSQREAA